MRPEHVKCIRSPFTSRSRTICGRAFESLEFVFMDIDHAYMTKVSGSRQQTCPECADQVIRMLQESKYEEGS